MSREVKTLSAIDPRRGSKNLTARSPALEQAIHFSSASARAEKSVPGSGLRGAGSGDRRGKTDDGEQDEYGLSESRRHDQGYDTVALRDLSTWEVELCLECSRRVVFHSSAPCSCHGEPGAQCRKSTAVRGPTLTAIGK